MNYHRSAQRRTPKYDSRPPTYDSRACSTSFRPRSAKRQLRKGSLVAIADAEPQVKDLSDGELLQEWNRIDQEKPWQSGDNEDANQRMNDIESEWARRYPGIPINDPEPPTLTAKDIMEETGLSRSAANKRLRMGLPRDLLLHPGKLPRGAYVLPESEKARNGMVIRKYHLYQIAEAAAALFCSKDPTQLKLIKLRDALEAAGCDLADEEEVDSAAGDDCGDGEAFDFEGSWIARLAQQHEGDASCGREE